MRPVDLVGSAAGIIGSVVIGIATLVTAVAYSGSQGQPYWPLSHWVVPTLEWALIIGILGWTFATSLTWWRATR